MITIFGICIADAWKAYHVPSEQAASHTDFASTLAHDMLYNDFDDLRAEDRVLVISSGRGEMQLLMSSLGGGATVPGRKSRDNGFPIDKYGLYSRSELGVDSSSKQKKRGFKTW